LVAQARAASPAIIFFDEIDALASSRDGAAAGGGVGARVLSQLLHEMDGLLPLQACTLHARRRTPTACADCTHVMHMHVHVHMCTGRDGRAAALHRPSAAAAAAQAVLVVAATNRPDLVDAALLRPGRFDRLVHVTLPDATARAQILHIHTRRMPLAPDVALAALAERSDGYSGAELAAA